MANDKDTEALEQLARDMSRAKREFLGKLSERGYQLLRDEVPYETGNLKQGVAPADVDYELMQSVLAVSARSGRRGSGVAEVYNADGLKVRNVTLRPSPAYNYAEVVARGNKQATLSPKTARAFMIPVTTRPDGEGYLMVGGQMYILRRTRKGQKADPFDERAARRIEKEAPGIAEAVLRRFV